MTTVKNTQIKAKSLAIGDLLVETEADDSQSLAIVGKISSDGETLTVKTDDGYRLFNVEEVVTITVAN